MWLQFDYWRKSWILVILHFKKSVGMVGDGNSAGHTLETKHLCSFILEAEKTLNERLFGNMMHLHPVDMSGYSPIPGEFHSWTFTKCRTGIKYRSWHQTVVLLVKCLKNNKQGCDFIFDFTDALIIHNFNIHLHFYQVINYFSLSLDKTDSWTTLAPGAKMYYSQWWQIIIM